MKPCRPLSFTSFDLSTVFRTVFLLFGFGRFLPLHELFFLDLLNMAIHPNVARQFKPFGSANSCPQSIHSKAWCRLARSKKFTTVECIRSLGMADKRARLSAPLSAPNPECQIGCPTPPPRLVCLLWGDA